MSALKLSRRTFLRGAGTAMALPLLDAMRPTTAWAQAAPPKRFLAFYIPCGIHMASWTPERLGTGYDLPRILQPLARHQDDLLVLSGLANRPAKPDGPGDHAAGTGSFLTCAHVYKTEGANIRNGISIDQVLANALGGDTRFPSLELGAEGGGSTGNCDSGYSCAYSRNISWSGPQTPVYKEVNPRAVYDRLFAGTDASESLEARLKRRADRRSVLDFVLEDARRLHRQLGASDKRKLDEYMAGVRSIERSLEAEEDAPQCAAGERPPRPDAQPQRIRLMTDLMVFALQCDVTRVVTFMLGNAGSNRAHTHLGIPEGHHELSHHMGDTAKHAKLETIDVWEIEQLAYLLDGLAAVSEADGSRLLDNTVVFFSSEIEDGNSHAHRNLPVLLAGNLQGTLNSGRHVRYEGDSIANLFIGLAGRMGVDLPRFGDEGDAPLANLS